MLFCAWGRGINPILDPRRMRTDDAYQLEAEDLLEDFVIWLAVYRPSGQQVSAKSISKYVSSVRAWYSRFYRARLGVGAQAGRVNDILKGYAREVPQPPPLERHGCTPADLAGGMRRLYSGGDPLSLMWRAALSFGMVGLCRGCEFALSGSEPFEPDQHLVPTDVAFFNHGGRRHASVRMRKRKDLRVLRGKQARVLISGGGVHFDASAALEQWMECRAQLGLRPDSPLFCRPNGQAITVDEVRDEVRRVMQAAGRQPHLYGAHSLRIGGATAALAAGIEPQLIRLMGRWSSDIYELYCRMSAQAALRVGEAISSADVSPIGPAFQGEHLEFLEVEREQMGITLWRHDEQRGGDASEDEA